MAEWSQNPAFTELENIMAEKATRQVGLTAEQFNKVMENLRYLKNLYDLYKVELGTVTTTYGSPGTPFDVQITHRQEYLGGELTDFLDFHFTVAMPKFTSTVTAESVRSTDPPRVTIAQEILEGGNGYNLDFDFEIPKGEVAYAECTDITNASGNISVVLEHETDKTYNSDNITKITMQIPSNMFHGFFAGLNFKVGGTEGNPTEFVVVNNSTYPLKLLRRGTKVNSYDLVYGKTVMLVANCDGMNVYCNLIEV